MNNLEWLLTLSDDEISIVWNREYINCWGVTGPMFARWLASPHIEPIHLTPEERKAVQLVISMGLPWMFENATAIWLSDHKGCGMIKIRDIPALSTAFTRSTWISENALDLREVLKNDK